MWRRPIKIALVGRPNVGKSALFNRIIGKQLSIVEEWEGVTRDRLYGKTELFGTPLEIIDTGGINPYSSLPFKEAMKRQTQMAIEEADALIMVVDAQVGVTDLDEVVARLLRPLGKPVCLAVNKVDNNEQELMLSPFYSLGIPTVIAVSASHGLHIVELLQPLLAHFREKETNKETEKKIKTAIIGRTNVGKSTLLNALLKEERSIVSEEAGTTRDPIDVDLCIDNILFTFIDTAGIRRKKVEREVLEKYAAIRTKRAIERCDVCLLVLDAQSGITTQEKRILSQIEKAGRGCLLLFNKWDLITGYRMEHCLKEVQNDATFIRHCPTLFGSAKTGHNLDKIFAMLQTINQYRQTRVSTGSLNQWISKAIQKTPPPMRNGKRLRVYYLTQIGRTPPRFVLFVNNPALLTLTYKKYLLNQFRKQYPFTGTPIVFYLKKKALPKKGGKGTISKREDSLCVSDLVFEKDPNP